MSLSKRVTIMIDDDLDKLLRLEQAKQITKSTTSVNYSRIINQTIRKGVKN